MITSFKIENFKSLREVELNLGPLNIFIGTNASGKSNVFDAFRILQGIGNGFTLAEILDGKPRSSTSEIWEPIRGGSAKATFASGSDPRIRLEVRVKTSRPELKEAHYCIGFDAAKGRLTEEWLSSEGDIYDSREIQRLTTDPVFEVKYYQGKKGRQPHLRFEPSSPVLTQLPKKAGKVVKVDAETANCLAELFANMQRLDPSPSLLRAYSQAQRILRMGERGENFAALVRTICTEEKTKDAYLAWLRQLRPAEVDDVGTLSGAIGDTLFMLREGGKEFAAPVLSDGTLRFAAIAAAFFQPDMPALLTLEEIENGIHASRLRLLVELLRNRTQERTTQVIVTTHSPIVLAWLNEEEYAHTFFCKRDEETGESRICPLAEIPKFEEVVKRQPIGDLFAEGWMEAAL